MREHRYLAGLSLAGLAMALVLSIAGCGSDDRSSVMDPVVMDTAPPVPPAGTQLMWQMDGKFAIRWNANSEPDLAGYRVYRYEPDPARMSAYVCVSGAGLLAGPKMTMAATQGTAFTLRVSAVDLSGNESAMGESCSFTFAPSTTPPIGEGELPDGRGGSAEPGSGGGSEPAEQNDPHGRG
ncbi:MAG: hypothetical protein FJY88_03070 [Candidatus Eisenbacteria bacterium]|nr:hypothetical protein [Candidatus Eisenbacteria bacterium]